VQENASLPSVEELVQDVRELKQRLKIVEGELKAEKEAGLQSIRLQVWAYCENPEEYLDAPAVSVGK
jgi:hypothetical protein